jgi:hypothetical protein
MTLRVLLIKMHKTFTLADKEYIINTERTKESLLREAVEE